MLSLYELFLLLFGSLSHDVELNTFWNGNQSSFGAQFYKRNRLNGQTSSAGAERSDGPHKGGLRRDGPNDFMFVNDLIQKDLSISILFVFIFLLC